LQLAIATFRCRSAHQQRGHVHLAGAHNFPSRCVRGLVSRSNLLGSRARLHEAAAPHITARGFLPRLRLHGRTRDTVRLHAMGALANKIENPEQVQYACCAVPVSCAEGWCALPSSLWQYGNNQKNHVAGIVSWQVSADFDALRLPAAA
jgi:hypothetical protein